MADINLSDYKALYLQTARKYVTDIQSGLAVLDSDLANKDAIESIYISTHSLKSQSQVMTYVQTGALSGEIEALFRAVREGKVTITAEIVTQLKQAAASLAASLDSIEKDSKESDLAQAADAIHKIVSP